MPEFDSTIRFAPIPEYPGYIAGSDGTIWSTKGMHNGVAAKRKPVRGDGGYCKLNLSCNGRIVTRLVHQLILLAFRGPCPSGCESRHLNGRKSDNRIDNLLWGTPSENMADIILHGTRVRKLSESNVIAIRSMFSEGRTIRSIGKQFMVGDSSVKKIVTRKTWKHVA